MPSAGAVVASAPQRTPSVRQPLVSRSRFVGRNRALEVAKLLAGEEANIFEDRELILGFTGLTERKIDSARCSCAPRWRRLNVSACW